MVKTWVRRFCSTCHDRREVRALSGGDAEFSVTPADARGHMSTLFLAHFHRPQNSELTGRNVTFFLLGIPRLNSRTLDTLKKFCGAVGEGGKVWLLTLDLCHRRNTVDLMGDPQVWRTEIWSKPRVVFTSLGGRTKSCCYDINMRTKPQTDGLYVSSICAFLVVLFSFCHSVSFLLSRFSFVILMSSFFSLWPQVITWLL